MVLRYALYAYNPRALGIEDDYRDAEGEVLEVLAHTEEIRGHGVIEQEVLDLPLDIAATRVGVVLQPAAVAHLGIEHLTGGEGMTKVCCSHTAADAATYAANFVELKVRHSR